jgi:PBP1b-binding outer membrane lipoprotein LpoB
MKKMHGIALVGAAALLLAACGSSDNGPGPTTPVATTDIPTTATTDSAGLLSYVNGQVGVSSDSSEPIL